MKTCRTFFLGSNQSEKGHSFRGHLGGLILWGYARTHEDLLKRPLHINKSDPVLAMWADFTNVSTIPVCCTCVSEYTCIYLKYYFIVVLSGRTVVDSL